jgi:single-strand DNA-binding protein
MAGLNRVLLLGRLGKDPEVKSIGSGTKVANFSIATSETYKDRDGNKQEKTEWHNIVMWRGLADIAERYLRKGSQVFIEGKLQTRSWENQEGKRQYITEIVADGMQMIGSRNDSQQSGDYGQQEPF